MSKQPALAETTPYTITSKQAFQYFGIKRGQLHMLRAQGKLRYSKVGKTVVVFYDDIKKIIDSSEVKNVQI